MDHSTAAYNDGLIAYTMAVDAWDALAATDFTPHDILKSVLNVVIRAAERCQATQPQGELLDAWQPVVEEWTTIRDVHFPPQTHKPVLRIVD